MGGLVGECAPDAEVEATTDAGFASESGIVYDISVAGEVAGSRWSLGEVGSDQEGGVSKDTSQCNRGEGKNGSHTQYI